MSDAIAVLIVLACGYLAVRPAKRKALPPANEPFRRLVYRPTWRYCARAADCPVPPGEHPWKDKSWTCRKCGREACARTDYQNELLTYRETFEADPSGWLVSSLLADGRHAPAIDLDFPADLYQDAEGTMHLSLERGASSEQVLFVQRALYDAGLSTWDGYRAVERSLAPPADGLPGNRAPDGQAVAALRLAAATRLVPSHTPGHFHLYVDQAVSWQDYECLLRAMQEAGFVEKGFYLMALRRGMTMLRKGSTSS